MGTELFLFTHPLHCSAAAGDSNANVDPGAAKAATVATEDPTSLKKPTNPTATDPSTVGPSNADPTPVDSSASGGGGDPTGATNTEDVTLPSLPSKDQEVQGRVGCLAVGSCL